VVSVRQPCHAAFMTGITGVLIKLGASLALFAAVFS
jgi:hypothetical protein